MRTTRRAFVGKTIAGGISAALPVSYIFKEDIKAKYTKLDEILKKPVFKREYFTSPVIIDKL
ncbi:MAG: hypothetical protein ACUVTX_12605, partial [Bacteroidales bacterium]